MIIGIPKEQRPFEFRVGLPPAAVEILCQHGHQVYVQHEAGLKMGFDDRQFEKAGARIAYSPEEVFGRADLVLKVTRPVRDELAWIQPGKAIAGLLHLSSARHDKVEILLEKKITAIAYEQIQLHDGSLPVLRPLSQIGGAMAAQVAARLLQNNAGGKGILLGGVPGVPPAEVVVLGAGIVGSYAAHMFVGMGAHVTVIDQNISALQSLLDRHSCIVTMTSTRRNIERATSFADVVVGAVLVPGQRAPVLVTRAMVQAMKPRSVIIDVSIDEGGCIETSRPTTHEHPVYIEEGVLHYAVPNMPAAVARTATYAFVNAAIPYIEKLANLGVEEAIKADPAIAMAVNTHQGELVRLSLHKGGDDGLD